MYNSKQINLSQNPLPKIHNHMQMESLVKRVCHVVRLVYYMLRKGLLSKPKLMMDLHLLLKRGKLAGKALANLMAMTFHHHHHGGGGGGGGAPSSPSPFPFAASSFSCISVDPTRDVEFSCTNTPSSSSSSSFFHLTTNRRRSRRNRRNDGGLCAYDAAAIAKAFEVLNDDGEADAHWLRGEAPTPSPALTWSGGACWKSPALVAAGPVRQVRITDSPFPVADALEEEEEQQQEGGGGGGGGRVDVAAEEFIRRFYEQLRMQRSAAATPDYYRR